MTNKIKGEVSLTGPSGEAYTLKFGFEALVLVEDKRKMAFSQVVEELDAGRLGAIGALFWAGVSEHHPEVSFEAAGRIAVEIVGAGRAQEFQAKIVEALGLAFPSKTAEVDASSSRPRRAEASTSSDAYPPGVS